MYKTKVGDMKKIEETPAKMTAVIHQSHDRMRGCVRMDDSKTSDWFIISNRDADMSLYRPRCY